jgi:hypothetical protein
MDAGLGHHLGLADFLAGDANGPGFELHVRNFGDFVGFDVGPVGNAMLIQVMLKAGNIGRQLVEINNGYGRI